MFLKAFGEDIVETPLLYAMVSKPSQMPPKSSPLTSLGNMQVVTGTGSKKGRYGVKQRGRDRGRAPIPASPGIDGT